MPSGSSTHSRIRAVTASKSSPSEAATRSTSKQSSRSRSSRCRPFGPKATAAPEAGLLEEVPRGLARRPVEAAPAQLANLLLRGARPEDSLVLRIALLGTGADQVGEVQREERRPQERHDRDAIVPVRDGAQGEQELHVQRVLQVQRPATGRPGNSEPVELGGETGHVEGGVGQHGDVAEASSIGRLGPEERGEDGRL